MVRAVLRLVLMVLVMAGVLVTTSAVGLPAAAVLGLSITTAGLVGMVSLSQRGVSRRAALRHVAAAPPRSDVVPAATLDPDAPTDAVVAAMAPEAMIDPESLMPRWRRPSLLAARRTDPSRVVGVERASRRFGPAADPSPNRRVVRYAVVSLLDRPDEVLGRQISDLMAGDEVEVLDNGGSFWEVLCPDGLRGWVHRTTLGQSVADYLSFGRRGDAATESDDILTAVLSARGIQ